MGCSTSPKPCVRWLNSPEGRGSAAGENPGITLAMWTTPVLPGSGGGLYLNPHPPSRWE
ncbi:MAG: hypothetical protein ACFFCS_00710 [Candidatus Hodarchaeota archaeon]